MKVTKLTIKNVGKIADTVIELNKPLILFYGEIRQGKTTILNAVRWVCGGEFPQDIIRHGEKEASVELGFDGGMISRSWYRAKDDTTKARAVVFVKNGKTVASPVAEIKRLLNPFLLDQDFLRNKSELERKQYFAELFAVDTTDMDTELFNSQRDATVLRSKLTGYGKIDLTKVEPVDVSELEGELRRMKMGYATEKQDLEKHLSELDVKHQQACEAVDTVNDQIRRDNAAIERAENTKLDIQGAIESHKLKIIELESHLAAIIVGTKQGLGVRPAPPDKSSIQKKILDLAPDTTLLERQISEAGATNVRAEQYKKNKARDDERKADETKLAVLEKRQREIKAEKQGKLKTVSDSCGIPGLSFDDAGSFIYQDTTAGMISDSQLMRLSSELSALYPDGFGIALLDRGESLGRSIFDYAAIAEKNKSSILATIVGEKPATVPANVGVWVVSDGKIIP